MQHSPLKSYRALLATGDIQSDPEQAPAVEALDRLWHELKTGERRSWWRRSRRVGSARGLYLWGGVGRGKTWLTDLFFESLPVRRKQRIHFHRFMARVHDELKSTGRERDPLTAIAQSWADRCRVLCFDEFYVSDIADAMLLAGLLEELFRQGTVLVATSNVRPDDLYRDGLQRARFLPAIGLLKAHTRVLHLAGDTDHRLGILKRTGLYHHPLDEAADECMTEGFRSFSGGFDLDRDLEINGRPFRARNRGDGVIWFEFVELCEKPRSALDYIEIARSFNTVLLSAVPVLNDRNADATRRFINLVDELYDRNVKLLVSAAAPVESLYQGDRLAFEFKRTASRLTGMQGHEYLARPHLP
ncbi:MAG: cell division protein ZapE [Xanthomonadales bacterium]|nr:cell division protein ZapE [Xanthomonadales bacterium]NIX11670.1 cell division protein ZapE [Xanthomonadales bacterium]